MDSQSIAYFSLPVGRYVVPGLAPCASLDRGSIEHGALGLVSSYQDLLGIGS